MAAKEQHFCQGRSEMESGIASLPEGLWQASRMIHLDTNYLVGAGKDGFITEKLAVWLREGEIFAVSSVAWSEFLTGPLDDEQRSRVELMIKGGILPFGKLEAQRAADIFNLTGRKRERRIDCMIAATAICARVPLATRNTKDFRLFVPFGLKLA